MANRLDAFPGKDLLQQYRNVFSHKEAIPVLMHMLIDLGTFADLPNISPEDAALKNYGARLLKIIGGGDLTENTVKHLVIGLVSNQLPEDIKHEPFENLMET